MNKKLVFIDIDGTLLNFNSELPESAASAIRAARANGHKLYIATGRCKPEIYDYVLNVGFDGIVGACGSYIETDGEVISSQHIPTDVLALVVDCCKKHNIEFSLEGSNRVLMSKNYIDRMKIITRGAIGDDMVARLASVMKVADNYIVDDINKLCMIIPQGVDILELETELGAYFDFDGSSISVEASGFCELTQKGITKATGIKKLVEYFNTSRDCTIAIGDSSNDRAMLEYAGTGVAMGNAGDNIKAISNYVTDHVNNDGLYKAFQHLELI